MSIRARARRQVALEFEPQYADIDAVVREARRALRSGTRAEKMAARAIIRSVRPARQQARRDYRQVARTGTRADRMLERDMGGRQNIFSDAIAASNASFARDMAAERADEFQELRNRKLRARDSQVYNTRALQAAFQDTQREAQADRSQLARQEGLALTALVDKLRDERQDRRMDQAQLDLSRDRHNLDIQEFNLRQQDVKEDNRRQAREDKGGLTPSQRRSAQDDIAQARSWLTDLRKLMPLADAAQVLIRGEDLPLKSGGKKTVPEIPDRAVRQALRDLRNRSGVAGFLNSLFR